MANPADLYAANYPPMLSHLNNRVHVGYLTSGMDVYNYGS